MRRDSCDIVGAALGKNKRKMAEPGLMKWLVAADKKRSGMEYRASNRSSGIRRETKR
jgi:hypothetical protein